MLTYARRMRSPQETAKPDGNGPLKVPLDAPLEERTDGDAPLLKDAVSSSAPVFKGAASDVRTHDAATEQGLQVEPLLKGNDGDAPLLKDELLLKGAGSDAPLLADAERASDTPSLKSAANYDDTDVRVCPPPHDVAPATPAGGGARRWWEAPDVISRCFNAAEEDAVCAAAHAGTHLQINARWYSFIAAHAGTHL